MVPIDEKGDRKKRSKLERKNTKISDTMKLLARIEAPGDGLQ